MRPFLRASTSRSGRRLVYGWMPTSFAGYPIVADGIPGARCHVFAESSHMPHVEENDAFTAVVGAFLRDHDTPARRG